MRLVRAANFGAAFVSIFLYVSLTITCFYFANRFYDRETRLLRGGRYAWPKFIFFVVLGCSALLDLPTFIGCVAHGGPSSCVWNDASYAFCWSCHLVATCGYSFAIITPSILWSDIVQQKDGNFINSASPLDSIKRFFRISYFLYCAVIAMTVIGVCMYSKSSNEAQYSNSNAVGAIGNCLTPILLFVITLGCVYSGRELAEYIRNVQLGSATQVKIIRKLNFTMMLIATTYGVRAMLVLSLFGQMPDAYIDAFKPVRDYPLWLFLTQWLPYLLCSFSLVNSMRFKEEGKTSSKRLPPGAVPAVAAAAGGRGNATIGAVDGPEDGRNSPSRQHKAHLNPLGQGQGQLSGLSSSGVSRTSFSIEGDTAKSPFDHTLSNDSSAHPSSTDGKTLDFLLAAATESSQKLSYFNHDEDDDDDDHLPGGVGAGADLEHGMGRGGGGLGGGGVMDHFFTTSALQARSVLSVVSSGGVAASSAHPTGNHGHGHGHSSGRR